MQSLVANGLVVAGIGVLVAALVPVRQLIKQLPRGRMRGDWYFLTGLILFFIAGYLSYAFDHWRIQEESPDLVVSLIYFSGACYIWVVNSLSLQTTIDVKRVTTLELENITDPLMGIYNRRYLERRLEEEVDRACRYGHPLSVLMIDVDHFKDINDTHGHQVGDVILKRLGELFVDAVRTSDIVARYGGEEICIVVSNTTGSGAAKLAERLRQRVASPALIPANAYGNQDAINVTVSIGVSSLGRGIEQPHALIESADKALYRAKNNGRNRVGLSEAISATDCAA